MQQEINDIELLSQFSTSTISDALDKYGVNGGLENIHPIKLGMNIIGIAYTLDYEEIMPGEEGVAGEFIDEVENGSVVVIANKGRTNCTVWGDILTVTAQLKGIVGTVIDGCCRDATEILSLNYPIFAKSTYMKSGKNRVRLRAKQIPVMIGNTVVNPGDIVRADDSGVIVIPKTMARNVILTAQKIEMMESNLLNDVKNGMFLREARIKHRYNEFSLKLDAVDSSETK